MGFESEDDEPTAETPVTDETTDTSETTRQQSVFNYFFPKTKPTTPHEEDEPISETVTQDVPRKRARHDGLAFREYDNDGNLVGGDHVFQQRFLNAPESVQKNNKNSTKPPREPTVHDWNYPLTCNT